MPNLVKKYSIIKREDLKFLKWCAVNQSNFHDANRFLTKKAAVRWARKRQHSQSIINPLESYVLLEDGSVVCQKELRENLDEKAI